MKNAYFNCADLQILSSCSEWNLVSSKLSDIHAAAPAKKYLEWINKNGDRHHYREIMVVLSGNSLFTLNGVSYMGRPGTIFLIDSNENHDLYYPPFCGNIRHLWFRILKKVIIFGIYSKSNGKIIDTYTSGANHFFSEYKHSGMSFIEAWDELSCNQHLEDEFRSACVKLAFAVLVMEICKAGYNKLLTPPAKQTGRNHTILIDSIVELIKKTGGRNLNISKLANIAGYSKFHFALIFRKVTGYSVLSYINFCRNAKYRELSAKGLNKKQISYELGFSCPAAFSRWLRDNKERISFQ